MLYVAPNGDDTQPGTNDEPLATLAGARDAIRKVRAEAGGQLPAGGVTVLIAGGRYPVDATWELTTEDSGTAESPIIYRAMEGQQPRFAAGVVLEGPEAGDRPERARPTARSGARQGAQDRFEGPGCNRSSGRSYRAAMAMQAIRGIRGLTSI